MLGGLSQTFITGVGKLEDRLVILLHVEAILTVDDKQPCRLKGGESCTHVISW